MIDKKELARALAQEYLGDEEQCLQDILEDPEHVGLLYTTFDGEDGEHDIQIELDLIGMLTHVYVDGELPCRTGCIRKGGETMSLKRETPCDYGECPYSASYNCDCEYWCGEPDPELWDEDD